jgi:hypothetical protein
VKYPRKNKICSFTYRSCDTTRGRQNPGNDSSLAARSYLPQVRLGRGGVVRRPTATFVTKVPGEKGPPMQPPGLICTGRVAETIAVGIINTPRDGALSSIVEHEPSCRYRQPLRLMVRFSLPFLRLEALRSVEYIDLCRRSGSIIAQY